MKFKYIYILILIFNIIGCKNITQKTIPINEELVIKEVESMFADYHGAIKKQGLTAEFDYLDNSKDFFWVPPNYNSALTYDSVKNILIANDKLISKIQLSFDTLKVFPLTDSLASYSGIVKGKMVDTLNTITKFKIIESGTLVKRHDGWKLLNGQSRNLD